MIWNRRKTRYSLEELERAFAEYRTGNEASKEALFEFLRSRLLGIARYRVPDIAEDIVHDALVVVHKRFLEFEAFEGLVAFTNQVLRNKIGNVYQSGHRHKDVTLDDTELPYRVEGEWEGAEMDRIVRQSIHKLGEDRPICRAILASLYQGLEPGEISAQLGISKAKLKVRTFRCRQALRDLLSRDYQLNV